jgi:hypothetical protein
MRQKLLAALLAFGGLCGFTMTAKAQSTETNWPTRPITMVVAYPPGAISDTVGLLFRFGIESEVHLAGQRLGLFIVGAGVLNSGLRDIAGDVDELAFLRAGGLLKAH